MSEFECNICGYLTGGAEMDEKEELKQHLEIEHQITGHENQKTLNEPDEVVVRCRGMCKHINGFVTGKKGNPLCCDCKLPMILLEVDLYGSRYFCTCCKDSIVK